MKNRAHYGIYADLEEQDRVKYIKLKSKVKTNSAALRAAIIQASDALGFAMPQNVAIDTKHKET